MATLYTLRSLGVVLLSLFTFISSIKAQDDCAVNSSLAQGYSVSISSVTENVDGTYTIVLTVYNDGCSGCRKLNSFTVQAAPGTYSNVIVAPLYGPFTFANVDMGPNLSGTSLTGFRINNTNGMGNGQAAAFTITYTLTTLQNQQTVAKAGPSNLTSSFTVADFQSVLTCQSPPPPPPAVIFPYFEPYANKLYDIIGVELTSLYYTYLANGTYISDDIFQIIGNSVRVAIRTQPGQHENAVALLTTPAYGLIQELDDPEFNEINGTIPILNLLSLNLLPELLVSVRPIYAGLTNAGLITSQGDTAMRSFRARHVFGVNGQGVKVGVLSDSYNTILGNPAADDVLRKDLPGVTNPDHPTPVHVLQDFPFGTRTDEGRAMLQIVHDVAPGAELAFRTGFMGPVDFARGIKALQLAGCDVIVDDITYISEPMFRDGVVAQAVNEVKALGVSYFSAAGNFGTRSWEGTFAPVAAPAGVVGQAHNFASGTGGTDILQNITLYQGEYTLVFQWDDGTPGTTTNSDFDIYLANTNGSTLFGFNRMNIGGDPMEILPFVVTADSVQSNIVIVRESGTGPAFLKYIVYRGNLKINEYGSLNASTIAGHANADGAISVGAVLYTNTPEYSGVAPTVASFSSRGGTLVNSVDRQKPDICAPNGVNTSVDLGGPDYEGDGFPNFFGTSAAAPHAAGVAALLLEARAKYYGDVLSPDGVKGILQSTALDMHAPGYDVLSGAGFILADSALKDLANPAPYLHSLSYDGTLTPGIDTLELTIYGEYLTSASTVWFDGVQLTNEVVMQGDTAIITMIYPFTGLYPAIQVYNPPMAGTNGLDGGFSNPLYFTDKQTILVTLGSSTKKYGETLPAFTAEYSLVGLDGSTPLASAGLTQAELDRIQGIGLTTIATPLSNVGLWAITTDPSDPLSPNSNVTATDPLDISILEQYTIVRNDGLLTIEPADLKIIPRDTTFVYNDPIIGLTFDYLLNDGSIGGINMSTSDSLAIVNAVKATRGTALVNATGLVRGTALVNNDGEQLLNDSLLLNFSFMISQRVTTTRGTALVNGELIDPEELYFAATGLANTTARSVRGTALVNAYRLVRGTALVNTIDSLGSITNTSPLVNSGSLVNNSGDLNPTTITLNSNSQTLVILGDDDIAILSGNDTGSVVMRSVNLITGNTVGTHRIIPGTFLSNNFNITYGLGTLTILPDTAEIIIDPATLLQTYTGGQLAVGVTVQPDSIEYLVTYDGSTTLPVEPGTYAVQVLVTDPNHVGSAEATLVIEQAAVVIAIDPTTLLQTYTGDPLTVGVSVDPVGIAYTVTYDGSTTPPVNAGTYAVLVVLDDPNYVGSAQATFEIEPAGASISIDPNTLVQVYTGDPLSVGVTIDPAGLAYTVTYDGSTTPPTSPGSYVVLVTVTDPNYTGSLEASMEIGLATAQISIDPNTLLQTYTGDPLSVGVTVDPAGLPYTVTYDGSATLPVNAGSYAVSVTVDDPNYLGSLEATLVIEPAAAMISIDPATLAQAFTGEPLSVDVTVLPTGVAYTVTYDGGTSLPVDPGSYAVLVVVNDPNYTGSLEATIMIGQGIAGITIDPATLLRTYTGVSHSVGVTTIPAGLAYTVTYNGSAAAPVNAGSYAVQVIVGDANFSGSQNATLVIQKAGATVSTGVYVINRGDPLPTFVAEYDGFVNGENASVVTSVSFALSPNYTGNAGVYAIIPSATALNYAFTPVNGTLYVNPSGPGTKQVKPSFECFQALTTPDANGFTHIAHFTYQNPNNTPVYVPIGPNNSITTAAHDPTNHPELLLPGTYSVLIPYMGGPITWQVVSNKNSTAGSIPANSSNKQCTMNLASLMIQDDEGNEADAATGLDIRVYPNPSTGRVFVEFPDGWSEQTLLEVYNTLGMKCPLQVSKTNDRLVEIDLSPLGAGMYIINILKDGVLGSRTVIIE